MPGLESPFADVPAASPPATVEEAARRLAAHPVPVTRLGCLADMFYGVWWMFRYHLLYFIIFGAGVLLIWSLAGGAMCRMTAVQLARDEKLTLKQGLKAAQSRLFGGYFIAPCIPVIFALIVVVLMVIGGAFLRIPVLGDFAGGLAFPLAIFGGFVIAALMLGLIVGGSLLWPTVAAEGSDAFDAFSRSLSYTFTKPWKTIIYAVLTAAYAVICWWFIRWFTLVALTATRVFVGFGTSPFGWWRGEGEQASKLDMIWPVSGAGAYHAWPDWSSLSWYECVSAVLIAICVMVVMVLVWSFLTSFYYSGSTVVYMLLRRDVDSTDLGDIYLEEPEESEILPGGGQAPSTESEAPAPPAFVPESAGASDAETGPAETSEPDKTSEGDTGSEN
jgi:hypothetical protein